MLFHRFAPAKSLESFVECYWVIESEEKKPVIQKIIPDGFPEIIFHYGDPYRINMHEAWELQSNSLLAGQLKKYFFLENTGASGVVGIKFKPAGLAQLFGFTMYAFTDKVISLSNLAQPSLKALEQDIRTCAGYSEMIMIAETHLQKIVDSRQYKVGPVDKAIDLILDSKGAVSISEIEKSCFVTERWLQRMFQKYVGLSPKFYSRIIRFNFIFQLMQEGNFSWLDITHRAGYFDQSHFIRDFKAFTGEDPSCYFFEEPNIANFFLKKE